MNSDQPADRDPRSAYRDEVGPDDGLDPRTFLRRTSRRVTNRKALQLCAQVQETLDYVFAWECGDRLLAGLSVVSVVPAPNASRLLVTVCLPEESADRDPALVLEQLTTPAAGCARKSPPSSTAGAFPTWRFRLPRPR